jgi:hypothetical protein
MQDEEGEPRMLVVLSRCLLLGLVLTWSAGAIAQAFGVHPPAHVHDPFTGLKRADGTQCCHGVHCRAVESCTIKREADGFLLHGRCWPINRDLIVPHTKESAQVSEVVACVETRWDQDVPKVTQICVAIGTGI